MQLKSIAALVPVMSPIKFYRNLTLRVRLAFGMSFLFVLQCIGLLLFINIANFLSKSNNLPIVSLIGLGLAAGSGGLGAYWFSGLLLLPLRRLSEAVHTINADNMTARLAATGPADEIKELAEAFNQMLGRLQQAFEQQSRFVGDAAHELRTPLATMRTNLEVVRHDPQAELADYRQMSLVLERSVNRLERLVNDLLLLASGQPVAIQDTLVLGALLEDVVTELEEPAHTHNVAVRLVERSVGFDELITKGDAGLLGRVFSNLVENAIRYNRPGGEVTLELSKATNWISIDIKDTGYGIPLERQNAIFERFYRLDQSRSRHKGGAGLGLSIARHILEQHGGQLILAKSDANGSIFTVKLPAA